MNRPDYVSWAIVPFMLILGLIAGDKVLDIQLHDTYYVIAYQHLTIISTVYFLILGLVYHLILRKGLLTKSKLVKWHVVSSVIGFVLLMVIASFTGGLTDGDSLSMYMSVSYTFIILIIIGLISIIFGVMMAILSVLKWLVEG